MDDDALLVGVPALLQQETGEECYRGSSLRRVGKKEPAEHTLSC